MIVPCLRLDRETDAKSKHRRSSRRCAPIRAMWPAATLIRAACANATLVGLWDKVDCFPRSSSLSSSLCIAGRDPDTCTSSFPTRESRVSIPFSLPDYLPWYHLRPNVELLVDQLILGNRIGHQYRTEIICCSIRQGTTAFQKVFRHRRGTRINLLFQTTTTSLDVASAIVGRDHRRPDTIVIVVRGTLSVKP